MTMINKPIRECQFCGGVNKTTGKYCNTCYGYLRKHPEGRYPLPPKGAVHYAPNGDAICHICGEAQRKLGSHIAYRHHMSQNEYRDMFELYHNTRLSNSEYINNMSQINNRHKDKVVKENLIKCGVNTRISHENGLSGRKFQHKVTEKVLRHV